MHKIMLLMTLCLLLVGALHFAPKNSSGLHIALLVPAVHPVLDDIERGFKETMKNCKQAYTITLFNSGDNETLLEAQTQQIATGRYDLICTVGTQCTQTMLSILTQKGINTPLVFCAIEDPHTIGIDQHQSSGHTQVTGVTIKNALDTQLEYLKYEQGKQAALKSLIILDDYQSANTVQITSV